MEVKKAQIPSSNGNLSAVIHYPQEKTEKLAILCPGYLDTKDYKGMVGLAEALSMQGYTVVRFDPTGTWESVGKNSDYTTTQYLKDIKNVLEYMIKDRNYENILIAGHSRGGETSILYAARDSRISTVLAIMPSSERDSILSKRNVEWRTSNDKISYRDLPEDKSQKREFHIPFSYFQDLKEYDVISDVKKVKVPVILIAGELDGTCTPESIKRVFDNANEPKKFITIPAIGHDYRHNDNEVRIVNDTALKLIAEVSSHRSRSKI